VDRSPPQIIAVNGRFAASSGERDQHFSECVSSRSTLANQGKLVDFGDFSVSRLTCSVSRHESFMTIVRFHASMNLVGGSLTFRSINSKRVKRNKPH
jgi:hypothetical protein